MPSPTDTDHKADLKRAMSGDLTMAIREDLAKIDKALGIDKRSTTSELIKVLSDIYEKLGGESDGEMKTRISGVMDQLEDILEEEKETYTDYLTFEWSYDEIRLIVFRHFQEDDQSDLYLDLVRESEEVGEPIWEYKRFMLMLKNAIISQGIKKVGQSGDIYSRLAIMLGKHYKKKGDFKVNFLSEHYTGKG